ncbi:MAG: hypothetical protein DSY55_04930 [Clostridia bacterium]|nr:MAG: hypothetical protein DSY55_04930 [Clostridia bacterium]
MTTFTLSIPRLSSEQKLQLEETLLKVPLVDALDLDDGTASFEITAPTDALRDMVSALYGWGSEHSPVLRFIQAVCGENALVLGEKSPNQIIHFLSLCDQ